MLGRRDRNACQEEVVMDNDFYADGTDSETLPQGMDVITERRRDVRLNSYMMRLADTMVLLSRELAEVTESTDAIDLRYVASLIEDTRKA